MFSGLFSIRDVAFRTGTTVVSALPTSTFLPTSQLVSYIRLCRFHHAMQASCSTTEVHPKLSEAHHLRSSILGVSHTNPDVSKQ